MSAVHVVDLNADLGEGFGAWRVGDDGALLEVVTSANIACGFHAGDPSILRATVRRAAEAGVAIGAHPGWPDLWGFGRRAWADATPDDTEAILLYQLGAFVALCRTDGLQLEHIKLHGALAHQTAESFELATAAANAIGAIAAQLPPTNGRVAWTVLPNSAQEKACRMAGLRPIFEAYVDRAYGSDGRLLPRGQLGALLTDPWRVANCAVEMVRRQALATVKGTWLPTQIDTLCVHGDTPNAIEIARSVRHGLEKAGLRVLAPRHGAFAPPIA